MMKLTVTRASCKVRFRKFLGGSVIKGTVYNRWDGVETHLAIESDEPAARAMRRLLAPDQGRLAVVGLKRVAQLLSARSIGAKVSVSKPRNGASAPAIARSSTSTRFSMRMP